MHTSKEEKMKDYDGFVEKFKPKKTTDDCYTPPEIYETIKNWACDRYGIDESKIVRPFHPNGDYENYKYDEGAIVLDNPPFSILANIIDFYLDKKIDFFLFCPSLISFGYLQRENVNLIISDNDIIYENGASVRTAFITTLGEYAIESEPTLHKLINDTQEKIQKQNKKTLPKYTYPPEVLTVNDVMKLTRRGGHFRLRRKDMHFIRALESQKKEKKNMFGSGVLISKRATAKKMKLEKLVLKNEKEKGRIRQWELSEKEKQIISNLG